MKLISSGTRVKLFYPEPIPANGNIILEIETDIEDAVAVFECHSIKATAEIVDGVCTIPREVLIPANVNWMLYAGVKNSSYSTVMVPIGKVKRGAAETKTTPADCDCVDFISDEDFENILEEVFG